jgi:hypothetical protein
MKLINYLLIALVFISSCKEETEDVPVLPKDYGDGMYIVTDNGISFYDGEVVKNQIYKTVNASTLLAPKKIKFKGTKAYIISDKQIVTANIETFENKDIFEGFVNPVDFDFMPNERLFVVDKGDAKVKVVDLLTRDITSDIETGDNANPTFIISSWYRSLVLNGGAVPDSLKDSTIIAIDYKDGVIPLADFSGSIEVGENPNSAVWVNDPRVLCKGIYDENNLANNTFSSLSKIDAWNMDLAWNVPLNGIYNANNLVSNSSGTVLYFTASDGIYKMSDDGASVSVFLPFISDILKFKIESYAVNDTTNEFARMFFVNDAVNANNTIYKYNSVTGLYVDTIIVDGSVNDINFY